MIRKERIETEMRGFLNSFRSGWLPPEFLAGYEPLECLGVGEWSETLLVKNKATGAPALAKCFETDRAGGGCNEGELLKRLSHPGLPAWIGEYRNGVTTCIVREYIEGKTLCQAARDGSLTQDAVVEIGIQLCDILIYLHGRMPPVIHRDIKPENIILKEDGRVVLIDFGISRTFDKTLKSDTQKLGTLSFAPPEQYGFSQTDCRSDIFSLGMVLGCLLTNSTELERIQNGIPDRSIRNIVRTCTAFAPKQRYASAAKLKRALMRQRPKTRKFRRGALAVACLLLVGALTVLCSESRLFQGEATDAQTSRQLSGADAAVTGFTQPLVEQAVRAMLGKNETEEISKEELASVQELYVFADKVSDNQEDFYASAADWYAGRQVRGDIASLEDVRLLPNLRTLCLAAQQITDLSPLEGLNQLEKVEFKHNGISDLSALAKIPTLVSVGINDNPVTDLSPLADCKGLRFLDLCDVMSYDPSVFDRMGDFEFLDIANRTDSYAHLGSRCIRELKLGYSGLDSLSCLSGVTGLTKLEVKHSKLTSLSGIENHTELTYLNIAGCAIEDLSPVLLLPELKTLVISEDMEAALATIPGYTFEVTFE